MSLRVPDRLDLEELIDGTGHDPAELRHSLGQVARVDRVLGGERGMRRALAEALVGTAGTGHEGAGDAFLLLDVGAGNGAVANRLGGWLRRHLGRQVRVMAVDAHPEVVDVGRRESPGLTWVRADGRRLPLPDDSADVVVCVLTLHHFDRRGAVQLLREMARVAQYRVVVSDLERSRAHWFGARVLASTLWRGNRLTREDGPTSVLRGWTRGELAALCEEAGLDDLRVRRHVPWRLVASARPGPRPGGQPRSEAELPTRSAP
jgi:ubiquinone/menaquinone biosynthesis C-methylase UbiE